MVINAIDTEMFYISLTRDESELKTKFGIVPLRQNEYLKIAGTYQISLKGIEDENDSDKLVEIFAGDKGAQLQKMLDDFFKDHVAEIVDIDVKGEIKTLKGDEVDINLIQPFDIFDLLSQTVNRISVSGAERKNLS